MTLYYTLTQKEVLPPSPEAVARKDDWIKQIQREVKSEWEPTTVKVEYRIYNREIGRIRKFFEGPVVEYWLIQKGDIMEGRPESKEKRRARETLLWNTLGYEVELMDRTEKARRSTSDFTDTQEWHDFLEMMRETEFEPNGYEFPDSKAFWEMADKVGYEQAKEAIIDQLQRRMKARMKSPEDEA